MGVKSVTRQTLESWRKSYEKKQFTIADKRAGRVRGSSDYNKNIVSTFAKGQFSSAREMHRCTGVPLSTICYNLNQSGMRNVHFRKVPYILSEEMKALRVEYSQTMLDILKKQKQHNFMDILTMDETIWFVWSILHTLLIWYQHIFFIRRERRNSLMSSLKIWRMQLCKWLTNHHW